MRRYGPNTSAIETLLARAERLSLGEIRSLAAARARGAKAEHARNACREAAQATPAAGGLVAALDRARSDARTAVLEALWSTLVARANDGDLRVADASDEARDAGWSVTIEAMWDGTKEAAFAAASAAADAAGALVVRDEIQPRNFDALFKPWAAAIERR